MVDRAVPVIRLLQATSIRDCPQPEAVAVVDRAVPVIRLLQATSIRDCPQPEAVAVVDRAVPVIRLLQATSPIRIRRKTYCRICMNAFCSPKVENLSWKASPVGAIEAQKSKLKCPPNFFKLNLLTITTRVMEGIEASPYLAENPGNSCLLKQADLDEANAYPGLGLGLSWKFRLCRLRFYAEGIRHAGRRGWTRS